MNIPVVLSVESLSLIKGLLTSHVHHEDDGRYARALAELNNTVTKNGLARKKKIDKLAARDGYWCFYCKVEFTDELPPTIDHVTPKSLGGSDGLYNLVLACYTCNEDKGGVHGPKSFKPGTPSRPKRVNGNSSS